MFSESKRYVAVLFQYGEMLLDSDVNDFGSIIQNQMQRLAQNVLGDVAVGDAWSIESNGGNNDFTINGGSGSLDGSGRCWVGGLPCLLTADKDFSDVVVTEPNVHACSTLLEAYVLTDTSSAYEVNELIDRYITPNITDTSDGGNPAKFKIISNTATTIETDPADGSMLVVAAVGDRYRVELSTYATNNGIATLVIDAGHSPVATGSTEIYTSDVIVQGKADNFYKYMLLRYTKAAVTYTHRVTASETGTGKITFEPATTVELTSGVETFDLVDVRYDTVYLDTYLDEIGPTEDTDLWHDEAGVAIEGARRLQVIQRIFVDEGDARARRLTATYTDTDGNSHYTVILANFKREYAQATIPDSHILSPVGDTYGDGAGGGDDGSGSGGGGLEEDADLASIVAEVVAARLGKADLKTLLTATLFDDNGDIALKIEELSNVDSLIANRAAVVNPSGDAINFCAEIKRIGAVVNLKQLKVFDANVNPATIDEIETVLTDSNTKVPTSKAVKTHVSTLALSNLIIYSGVSEDGVVIPTLPTIEQTSIVSDIDNSQTTGIVLTSKTGFADSGVVTLINAGPALANTSYAGANGADEFTDDVYGFHRSSSQSMHEQISYTGIDGANQLTGVTRNVNNTTAVAHKAGTLIWNGELSIILSVAMLKITGYATETSHPDTYLFCFLEHDGTVRCYVRDQIGGGRIRTGLAAFSFIGKRNPD